MLNHRSRIARSLLLVVCTNLIAAPIYGKDKTAAAAGGSESLTVELKNGATYRGELVERVPGDHVTIKLATGEVKRFEWSELAVDALTPAKKAADDEPESTEKGSKGKSKRPDDDDEEAKKKPEKKVTYDDPAERVSSGGSSSGRGATVFIDNEQGAYLERNIGTSSLSGGFGRGTLEIEHWERVCISPCNISLPPGDYRLRGDGLRSSSTFRLNGGSATIKAHLGTTWTFTTGWVLALAGFGAGAGFAVLAAKWQPPTYVDLNGNTQTEMNSGNGTLWAIAVGAAAVGVLGVVLWVTNWNSVDINGESASLRLPVAGGVSWTPRGFEF